jgi:CRP-like cAMP-binding protein
VLDAERPMPAMVGWAGSYRVARHARPWRITLNDAAPARGNPESAAIAMTVEARPSRSRSNHHSPLWYFERFGLLDGLSEQQKQEVERHTRMVNVRRGQTVYLPGDPSDYVYVVKTGAVKIVGKAPEGGEVILALLTPGDIFGELALMGDDGPRDDRVEAVDDALLCEVPRSVLVRMIQGGAGSAGM